jgi:hypothetical protein
MPARPSALLLLALLLAGPARAEPSSGPGTGGATGAEVERSLSKLRSLLLDRLPGLPLKAPGSPRYLALEDRSVRGTRVLVGWVLPGPTAAHLPDARALADSLSAALRASPSLAVPFDATVTLDTDGEAPLLAVDMVSARPAAARALEAGLLDVVAGLVAAPPEGAGRIAGVARTTLRPLSRAVVEVHRPGSTAVSAPIPLGDRLKVSDKRPPMRKGYVVAPGDTLAKVARKLGVSEKALVETNRLGGRRLREGQRLVLPR